jgi:hypothetical protein
VLGHPSHAGDQQVTQRVGQAGSELAVANQRLNEKRVAFGPVIYVGENVIRRLAGGDPDDEVVGVPASQPVQLEPGDPADTVELCQACQLSGT